MSANGRVDNGPNECVVTSKNGDGCECGGNGPCVGACEKCGKTLACARQHDGFHFKQPRGQNGLNLIPEFVRVVSMRLPKLPTLDKNKFLAKPLGVVPAGSRLLRAEEKGDDGILCVFGIYHTMLEFFSIARALWHPFDELVNLPDRLIKTVFETLTWAPARVAKARTEKLARWAKWAQELQPQENALKSAMHPSVACILEPKRLLLLERIAHEIEWEDSHVHKELREGFMLTGTPNASNIFKKEVQPCQIDNAELMTKAATLKSTLLSKIGKAGANPHCQELYNITCEEASEKKWLDGPFLPGEVDDMIGQSWIPLRRFAIMQKQKIRAIDDCSENCLNDAFTSVEKISLVAMQHIIWSAVVLMRHCLYHTHVQLRLSSGETLCGPVHKAWLEHEGNCLRSLTIDLKSAYKQLAVNPSEVKKAVVTLLCPSDLRPRCFLMRTLPFGAKAAVYHFNRVARLLWAIGCDLHLIWSNYFDDYPLLSHQLLESSTISTAKLLMKLLGYKIAEDKLNDFSAVTEMLGVELNLGVHGKVQIQNKKSRQVEVASAINEILQGNGVKCDLLPSLLGRLQFADLRIFGSAGKLAMADIRQYASASDKSVVPLTDEMAVAFKFLKQRICSGKPRAIAVEPPSRPVLVFTDGAYEPGDALGDATIGGVIIVPGVAVEVFGAAVPEALLEEWKAAGKEHLIGQTELYAVVVARLLWKEYLDDARFILFEDNHAVMHSLIKGTARDMRWRRLMLAYEKHDADRPAYAWYARVPSASNIADPPSRGSLDGFNFLEPFVIRQPMCPCGFGKLRSFW